MDQRVLVLAPRGRDAGITCTLLEQHGFTTTGCESLDDLVAQLKVGAGVALITEEALAEQTTTSLSMWVQSQPRWSDFPFVVLGKGGTAPRTAETFAILEALGNIVLLERPLPIEALLRATKSALQARRRQYEVRQFAVTLESAVAERTAELQGARESLEIALDAAEMGHWDLDLLTGISHRSQRHDQIFGYTKLLPLWGMEDFFQHVAPKDRAAVSAAFDAARKQGSLDIECQIDRIDGETRWIAVKGRVYYNVAHEPVRMTSVVSDISSRKEADAQLAQVQKMDTIGQLTGGVAHDFNNLLTPIVGSLDMLRRGLSHDERSQRLLNSALLATERAATLTQRLLAFARRQTLQPQAVDIDALITGLVELVSRSLGPTIEVIIQVPQQMAAARVDPNQLELALLNLAVNARDAMPSGGRLTIAAGVQALGTDNQFGVPAGSYVRIATSDNGMGMDPATLQRAIEPFFSTKGVGKGTGLGLSMVHGLAAQSGGALHLESQFGRGTTVELWLPATHREGMSASDRNELALAAPFAATVLLVDDEEIVRRATADMLTDLGYGVVQATSGSSALAQLHAGLAADIIVSDYLMPGINGGALFRELREAGIQTPMLLITGYANAAKDVPSDIPRLSKPFRQAQLAARLYKLICDKLPTTATPPLSLLK